MKPFVAKYIPVDGEITKNDYWLSKEGGVIPPGSGKRILYHANRSGCKKVELCLCSFDIKPLDEILAEPGAAGNYAKGLRLTLVKLHPLENGNNIAEIRYKQNPVTLSTVGKTRDWPAGNCFKVIGKISPGAKWVKENDQFDKADIRYMYYGAIPYGEDMEHEITQNQFISKKKIDKYQTAKNLEIKCPTCKHFH